MRSALIPILLNSVPGWVRNAYPADVLPSLSLAAHYDQDLYWVRGRGQCSIADIQTCTRAQTVPSYATTASGLLVPFAANTNRRTDLGNNVEQAATNLALWNRDLTNANWTPSSVTTAKDQVGMDGVANSASSLLATGNNGTLTAAGITSASASRTVTMGVMRLIGTGAVSISQDGGSTFTAITTKVGASWYIPTPTDFAGLTQTVTNPQIVIKLGTSGDKVAVDFVDLKAGSVLTSPIPTTTIPVARAADVITVNNASNYLGTASWSALFTVTAPAVSLSQVTSPFSVDDGSSTNAIYPFLLNGSPFIWGSARGTGASGTGGTGFSATANVPFKIGIIGRPGASSLIVAGGQHSTAFSAPSAALNRVLLGNDVFGEYWNGPIGRLALWKSDIGNASMIALST